MKIKDFKSNIFTWLNEPKWLNRLTLYFALGAVIITTLHIFLSYSGFLHTDVDSARYMLSALVQSEAAIVALVVTLSLVAVQLAAQSYSARVIEVFRRTPDLWILMGIYGIAMFYGLGVLKLIERANPQVNSLSNLEGHIAFSYYLGVFAFVALVPYIWNTLELLKPSTVIKLLAGRITKQSILSAIKEEQAMTAVEDPSQFIYSKVHVVAEDDPIQPLIDIVRGSLMKYDYETVRDGLRAIGDCANNIFKNEKFDDDKDLDASLLLLSHLSSVGELAARKDDEASTLEVITNLRKNGILAAEYKFNNVIFLTIDAIEEVADVAAKQKLAAATTQAIESLKWIGIEAAKQNLENAATRTVISITMVGMKTVEHRLEVAALLTAISIGGVGRVAAENKLENATRQALISLEEFGVTAANQKNLATAKQTTEELKEVLKIAKQENLVKIPDEAARSINKINEVLSKLEKE